MRLVCLSLGFFIASCGTTYCWVMQDPSGCRLMELLHPIFLGLFFTFGSLTLITGGLIIADSDEFKGDKAND